jgi:hypothetical protein
MEELYAYRKLLLDRLETVVTDLRVAAAAIPAEAWQTPLNSSGQTPHRILAHLRDVEAGALSVRLRRILDEDGPDLELFDDDGWMASHYDPAEPPQAILDEYARLRQQELSWLRDLPPVAWNRAGRHPWWGMRALEWWVEQTLLYTQQHLAQLAVVQSSV